VEVIRMANVFEEPKPKPGQVMTCLAMCMGIVTLVGAGLVSLRWDDPPRLPTPSLQRAISEFDSNHLTSATAAFRVLADKGDPTAAFWYGHALERGLGTQQDITAAVAQFQKALAGGVTRAGMSLGELYLNGNAIPPDFKKARAYLTAAAKGGYSRAALDLGRMYREGMGAPADPVAAYAWLEVASLDGNAAARQERNQLLPTLSPAQQAEAVQQATALRSGLGSSDHAAGWRRRAD
jgi:TPR repeat protein